LAEYAVQSSGSLESVRTFVAVCQKKEWEFVRDQTWDLLLLSDEWDVEELPDYLPNVISASDDVFLEGLKYAILFDRPTDGYEARARAKLFFIPMPPFCGVLLVLTLVDCAVRESSQPEEAHSSFLNLQQQHQQELLDSSSSQEKTRGLSDRFDRLMTTLGI